MQRFVDSKQNEKEISSSLMDFIYGAENRKKDLSDLTPKSDSLFGKKESSKNEDEIDEFFKPKKQDSNQEMEHTDSCKSNMSITDSMVNLDLDLVDYKN